MTRAAHYKALILGSASNMLDDAQAAVRLFDPDLVVVVNAAGFFWPGRIDVWCSLHPKGDANWPGLERAVKRRCKAAPRPETWSHRVGCSDHVSNDWGGSSGLFAVNVALAKGATHCVLAGVPMSDQKHIGSGRGWPEYHYYWKAWLRHRGDIAPYVRSMSGNTKELLGLPARHWLSSTPIPA